MLLMEDRLSPFQNQVLYHVLQYVPKMSGNFNGCFSIFDVLYIHDTVSCTINIYFCINNLVLSNIFMSLICCVGMSDDTHDSK